MRIPQRILVPDDYSAAATAALEYALSLARPLGAAVDVLHVWTRRPNRWEEDDGICALVDPRHCRATEDPHLAAGQEPVHARTRVEFGEPCSRIVAVANEERFDLIVMGAHARFRVAQLFRGDMAERVARLTHCPVITVHATMEPVEDPPPTVSTTTRE